MKGFNIKKLAALGIGAALVGSALAPVVSAAAYDNLSELERSDVVSDAGVPVVSVVAGSNAALSDVVWAGNIATRVAQLATTSAGEATGEKAVDITVGGTQSVSGSGDTAEIDFPATASLSVSNTKMPSLINNTSFKYKYNSSTEQSTTLSETINGDMLVSAQMETGSNRYAIGEMIGTIASGDLNYKVELGTNLDLTVLNGLNGLDANSQNNLRLPIFGKTYVLDEVKATGELVFYADTNPITLSKGESITVKSADGSKEYELKLIDITKTGPSVTDYTAAIQVIDDGVVIDSKTNITANENLKDKFSVELADVYITDLTVSDIISETGYATLRTGEDRIAMMNGKGFPYTADPAVDNIAQWRSDFTVAAFDGFTIRNYWAYDKTIGSETNTSKYVLKVGEELAFPNDFGTFQLMGFQDKPATEAVIGAGQLVYRDLKGSEINVPFYKQFDFADQEASVITIGNETYTLWVEYSETDFNIMYAKGNHAITTRPTVGTTWKQTPNMNFNTIGTSGDSTYELDNNRLNFDLGVRPYSGTASVDVNYVVAADSTSGIGYLLLANQDFDVYNRGGNQGTKLTFTGTTVRDANALQPGVVQPYFLPNMSEVITTALDGNITVDLNTVDSTQKVIQYNDNNYYAALFSFIDATAENAVTMAVRADAQGDVWNYNDLQDKTNIVAYGPSLDASRDLWGTKAIRDGTNYLLAAATPYGTEVVSDNSVFTLVIPEERRKVEAYLGSTDVTTTTVGGESFTDVAAGETVETLGGTKVTVDAIAGASGAGVTVNKAGSLVKLDTSYAGGRAIIVGGYVANTAAVGLTVMDGQTLEALLVNDGDYVSYVLDSGSIVVAGKNANDTATAAGKLVSALEALI